MGPRQIWGDLCRIAQGTVACVRYLRSQETIDVALGMFEAASSAVVVSRPCRYMVRLVNVSEKVCDVKMAVEVSSATPADSAAKPCARFAKQCSIPAKCATAIEFHYDWCSTVMVTIDRVASPPDEFWVGAIKPQQRYRLSAILSDHTGKRLDKLVIYQELQG
jgi:hypothetical protein